MINVKPKEKKKKKDKENLMATTIVHPNNTGPRKFRVLVPKGIMSPPKDTIISLNWKLRQSHGYFRFLKAQGKQAKRGI